MTVSSTRPDYEKYASRWGLVRDVIDSNATKFISDVDPTDTARNVKYKKEAMLTNFTSRTKSGLLGAVFRRAPIIQLPSDISYLIQDCTGFKMPLSKLAQEVVGEVLTCGRYGLLVDYPPSEDGLTAKEVSDLNLKARIYRYTAESIINWKVTSENGYPKLEFVVLKECVQDVGEDGYSWVKSDQYRVLRLIDGGYAQLIYNQDEELVEVLIPKDSQGNSWDHIPFVFVGSEDNDEVVDNIPLYDLAKLNIGHLRNSADYEESVHIVGQPTLIISTEMTQEEFNAANPKGVLIGARRGHNLGVNGKAEFLQANPNQLADTAMKRKEDQAIMIGARLITSQADRETAEAARMRHSGETSILANIASNVEEALKLCCEYALKFMSGKQEESTIKLNKQFFDKNIDPNLIMAQLQLLQSSIIAKSDVRQTLREFDILDQTRDDSDIDSENERDAPEIEVPVIPDNPNNPTDGT